MSKLKSIKNTLFMFIFAGVVTGTGMVNARAQTVWLVCHFDTSAIWKGQDGRDKFERRFYVSSLVSMSKGDCLRKTTPAIASKAFAAITSKIPSSKPQLRGVNSLIPAAA